MAQPRPHPLIIIAADRAARYEQVARGYDRAHSEAYAREERDAGVPASNWHGMTECAEELANETSHLFTGTTAVINDHVNNLGDWCPWSDAVVDACTYPYPDRRCPQACRASFLVEREA